MVRRVFRGFGAACLAAILFSCVAAAAQSPVVVVFYLEGCEDCERMMPVITDLEAQYPDLGFRYIEGADPDAPLMWRLAAAYKIVPAKYPVIFIGREAFVGANLANELAIRSAVEACAASACPSPLASIRQTSVPWLTILLAGLALVVLVVILL
jgi:hypothetical protein